MTSATSQQQQQQPQKDKDIEVREQDQLAINQFAILANQLTTLKQEISILKTDYDALEDAELAIMAGDETITSTLRYRLADVLISLNEQEFMTMIEQDKNTCKTKLKEAENKLRDIEEQQLKLKNELYTRFGDQIALEM
jgi:chaperonin cofactor prefoldin